VLLSEIIQLCYNNCDMGNLPVELPASIGFSMPSLETMDPQTLKAIIIGGGVFILAIFIGFGRRFLISSSLQGVWAGFIMGIVMVAVLEGALFWGLRDFVFGQKSASLPNNIRIVLDGSKENINQVLGIKTEKEQPTAQSVVSDFNYLSNLDSDLVKNTICRPQLEGKQ